MAKHKKHKPAAQPAAASKAVVAEDSVPRCPVCRAALPGRKIFVCPTCGMEIDYLLYAGIKELAPEQISDMKKGKQNLWPTYVLVSTGFCLLWLVLYLLVLRDCLTGFPV
jgi:hypothetical protein